MKKALISSTALLLILVINGNGQAICEISNDQSQTKRHEIGVNLFPRYIKDVPLYYSGTIANKGFRNNYGVGIMYKYNFHNNKAIRLGLDYRKFDFKVLVNDLKDYWGTSYYKGNIAEFRLGYEYQYQYKFIYPFVVADVFYQYRNTESSHEGEGVWGGPVNDNRTDRRNIFGIAPAIGLKIQPLKSFSVSAEINYSISYNPETGIYLQSFSEIQPRLISINYHF